MRLDYLTPVTFILLTPQGLGGNIPHESKPAAETVCSIKNAAKQVHAPQPKLVSLTAHPVFEPHHGYHLVDPRCTDQIDGTGMILVEFPTGKTVGDYPEFNKAFDQSFPSVDVGKRVYSTCVGLVSYTKGQVRFVLAEDCRVWSEA